MLLKYNAIACIDRICERFGKTNPILTYNVAQVVVGPHCLGSNDLPLRTLSLYCLASIVDILRNDFIPLLQQALEAAAGCLRESLNNDSPSAKLHNASYSFFTSVVDRIPFMVPQSFIRTTFELSLLSAAAALGQEATMNRSQFLQSAATRLDVNSIFTVAKLVWPSSMKHGNVVSTFLYYLDELLCASTSTCQDVKTHSHFIKTPPNCSVVCSRKMLAHLGLDIRTSYGHRTDPWEGYTRVCQPP